jgi:hypothetical protein
LGKHYLEVWAAEDSATKEKTVRQSTRLRHIASSGADSEEEEEDIYSDERSRSHGERPTFCGDLTQRILSALIEAKVIPEIITAPLTGVIFFFPFFQIFPFITFFEQFSKSCLFEGKRSRGTFEYSHGFGISGTSFTHS